jgi:hypothetical protein
MSTTHTKPAVEPAETLEHQFQRLRGEWDKDTAFHSNPGIIMRHPAMRAIIALGEPVVPVILRQLEAAGDLGLIWALQEITGENVAPPAIEGGFAKWNVTEQREAWLHWEREKGLA